MKQKIIIISIFCILSSIVLYAQEKEKTYCFSIPDELPLNCYEYEFQEGQYKKDLLLLKKQILAQKYRDEFRPDCRKTLYNHETIMRQMTIDPAIECFKCLQNLTGMGVSARKDTDSQAAQVLERITYYVYKKHLTYAPNLSVALEYAISDGMCNGFENIIKPIVSAVLTEPQQEEFNKKMKKNCTFYSKLKDDEKQRIMPFLQYALSVAKEELDRRIIHSVINCTHILFSSETNVQ